MKSLEHNDFLYLNDTFFISMGMKNFLETLYLGINDEDVNFILKSGAFEYNLHNVDKNGLENSLNEKLETGLEKAKEYIDKIQKINNVEYNILLNNFEPFEKLIKDSIPSFVKKYEFKQPVNFLN